MRFLYTLAWLLALPIVLGRLWWRGRQEPGYRRHLAERFGKIEFNSRNPQVIWVHAVSVGETRAAEPLVRQLMQRYGRCTVLLTHMTPTGRATGSSIFDTEIKQGRLIQSFLPYDVPIFIYRFLDSVRPQICILMETEVWPNLLHCCQQRDIPVALVNARLSEKSLRKGQRLSTLIRPATEALSLVAAQNEADSKRIQQLGAKHVVVTGNSKFDVTVPQEKIETGLKLKKLWQGRPVLLCASTREGEEALILDAFCAAKIPNLLLLIVPRHPQRFDEVEQRIKQQGLAMCRRSDLSKLNANTQVILGDSMGEMFAYYASCDIAFIGGSLLPLGGQNLIEASALAKPVLIGPHTFNFNTATIDAIQSGGAVRVHNATELMQQTAFLVEDEEQRARMGCNALVFAEQHRGATERTVKLLAQFIPD